MKGTPVAPPLDSTPRDEISISESNTLADGLPPVRNMRGKSYVWLDIYNISIPLPSSYSTSVVTQSCILEAAGIKKDLCYAEAEGALEDLRTAIINSEVLKLNKKIFSSKSLTTCMQGNIQIANHKVTKAADNYWYHWLALHALGLEENHPLY